MTDSNIDCAVIVSILCIAVLSGCLGSGDENRLVCTQFDYSNETDPEDEVVQYRNLSSENQTLFKKGINGTETQRLFIPSLNNAFIEYENSTYDCDIRTNFGA
jgi:hypothetical protein